MVPWDIDIPGGRIQVCTRAVYAIDGNTIYRKQNRRQGSIF